MLLYQIGQNQKIGGAKLGCFITKLTKVGGAIAPPAPTVPPPLRIILRPIQSKLVFLYFKLLSLKNQTKEGPILITLL